MLARAVSLIGYTGLTVFTLAFLFSNRAPVTLELFPFAHLAEMPLYVALCMVFAIGLLLGLLHSLMLWMGMRRKLNRANRAITALEKELAARPMPR